MGNQTGTEYAWDEFSKLVPSQVCQNALVNFDDQNNLYSLTCFGQTISISTGLNQISSDSQEGEYLLGIKDYFFDLSILWYLIGAKNIQLSGDLIKPSDVSGGQIFLQGTHVLPLDEIALKYNNKKDLFLSRASKYEGVEAEYGDVSVKLLPFPRVPVYLVLWFGDDSFPARGQLLLDSTCQEHLTTDVLWALTMVCCLIFIT